MKDGYDVKVDKHNIKVGSSLQFSIEQFIEKSDKVLIIFTPGYKQKADKREGGVGYEYSIINIGLYNNQTVNKKIIPILKQGSKEESIPSFMQQYIHVDFRKSIDFEQTYNDLKHAINDL